MRHNIKCVFSDLDRTFLNGESKISEGNRKAVEKLVKNGISFIPATGRAFMSLPDDLFTLEGVDLCITGNGCAIWNLKEKKPVFRSCLPKGFAGQLISFIHELGNPAFEVYKDGKGYCSREFYDDPAKYNQHRVEYVKTTRTPVDDIEAFFMENDGDSDGFTIISPAGCDTAFFEEAKRRFSDVYITHSDGLYVEFSSILSGKHNGLRAVCEILGVTLKESLAFGDNDNDIEMLRTAGYGVCVENGTEGCKAVADMIAPANTEDGFAKAVDILLF